MNIFLIRYCISYCRFVNCLGYTYCIVHSSVYTSSWTCIPATVRWQLHLLSAASLEIYLNPYLFHGSLNTTNTSDRWPFSALIFHFSRRRRNGNPGTDLPPPEHGQIVANEENYHKAFYEGFPPKPDDPHVARPLGPNGENIYASIQVSALFSNSGWSVYNTSVFHIYFLNTRTLYHDISKVSRNIKVREWIDVLLTDVVEITRLGR